MCVSWFICGRRLGRTTLPRPGTEEQPESASQPCLAHSYSTFTRKKPFSPMGESGERTGAGRLVYGEWTLMRCSRLNHPVELMRSGTCVGII